MFDCSEKIWKINSFDKKVTTEVQAWRNNNEEIMDVKKYCDYAHVQKIQKY